MELLRESRISHGYPGCARVTEPGRIPPMLLLVLGPPAVGKMTVGRAVAARSSYRLFHNHHSIEMLLDVFDYGTPPFRTLNAEIRRRVIEEAAQDGTDLVFTYVMGMDEQGEADYLERLAQPYGDRVAVVELVADLDTRLVRNRTEHRLAEKKSKRDVEWSDGNVRQLEADYRMTSEPGRDAPGERLLARWPHLVVDNTDLPADETADRILGWLAVTGW